ncbi:MAG: hypothetical protein H6883_14890 [Rhodobiaceae bacterium]|nr:hypothetical protein [Rhodobiaceae bacterium]MCC0057406.1 hypothetical protein [Rhodobiaceae bacterium]
MNDCKQTDGAIALEMNCLLGFDQIPTAAVDPTDLTKTARLLTKIGPELLGVSSVASEHDLRDVGRLLSKIGNGELPGQ